MAGKPVTFHSENIRDTKAREKREVFVNIEQKKTIKQSAEEFQRKFAEAKAHAAESRAKIENPGADEHGVVASHVRKPFPTKLVLKIGLPILILAGIGLAAYLNWPTIYHQFFEVSEAKAQELFATDPQKSIAMYDTLIKQAKTNEEKAKLYLNRVVLFDSPEYASQLFSDARAAEELYPSYTTAAVLKSLEERYGTIEKAEEWAAKLEERQGGEEIPLGNG